MILRDGRSAPIAPQAFAETRPLFYSGYFLPDTGLKLETQFATYAQLYKVQPWVATVVNKISNLIARLGVNVWDESSPAGKVLDTSSPYAQLVAKPCATMDPYSFWLWISSTIEIYGEAFLLKMRDGAGRPYSLLPMHPAMTQIHRDDVGALTYRFMGRPNELIPESEVVPFKMYDPDSTMRGMSRLEPLRSTLMNEDSARRATAAWWHNMGRPSMVLSTEKRLGLEGKERLRQAFVSQHAGSGNTGGTVVLEDGVTATQMQLSAEEMQYIESRKLNREEVCAVYDVPPTAVHILDHATFCLPADALVSTASGPKPIAAVGVGDRVWSVVDGHLRTNPVTWAGQTGYKPLLTIKTQNRTLRCTDNHPVLTRRRIRTDDSEYANRRRYRWEHRWVEAGELSVGDVIVTLSELPEYGVEQCPTRTVVSEGFVEFCGLLLGDGNIMRSNGKLIGVSIARAGTALYMDHYRQIMSTEFTCSAMGGRGTAQARQTRQISLIEDERCTRFASVTAAAELDALGMGGTASTKRVPAWVFTLSPKLRAAFIRGFLDADGSVDKKGRISFASVNGAMLRQIRDLCMGLGVPVTNIRSQRGITKLPNRRLTDFTSWTFTCSDPGANRIIGSHDPRYQKRLTEGIPFGDGKLISYYEYRDRTGRVPIKPPDGCGHAKIVAIAADDVAVPVYDLMVDGSHNFIAEGVVVHNSNITEQMRSVYRDSMAPRIEFIESVLNWHVGVEFNGKKTARFAVAEVLRGDFEKRAPAAVQLVQSGIMKPSEARPLFDLDDAGPIADKLYANSAIQELGQPAEAIRIQAAEAGGTTPDLLPVESVSTLPGGVSTQSSAKLSPGAQKYVRDIGGAIGRGKSLQAAAKAFVDARSEDIDVIEEACRHIIERDS